MPKSAKPQSNFTSGEISPKSLGRFDFAKYMNAIKKMENFLGNQVGGAMYRPGTRFIAETKNSSAKSRLLPFQYSADQDYVMEIGDKYIRFFTNNAATIDLDTGIVLDYMEYASDAAAQAAYVTSASIVDGTGGTITHSGGKTIHTFLLADSGTNFVPPVATNVDVLIVGGGGGGGNDVSAGGGGAGGYRYKLAQAVTPVNYPIVVGAGGNGGGTGGVGAQVGFSGGDSSALGFTATGGGGGATSGGVAGAGGSGGGQGASGGAGNTPVTVPSQGNNGGTGDPTNAWASGGGGGSSSVGGNSNTSSPGAGGKGGDGTSNSISGAPVTYAGGGGGGAYNGSAGAGGSGGGGAGGTGGPGTGQNGFDATGYGSGGGGSGTEVPPTGTRGGNGSSGIVIISYPSYLYLQDYSEATIKTQGSYSLKAIAAITNSVNKTLTRTLGAPVDLTDIGSIKFDIYSSRTGANIKIGIHDSGGTTSEKTYSVLAANTWETVTWDISAVSNANKDAIDSIIITIVDAAAANTFYIDNMYPVLTEVTTPYAVADIFNLQVAQNNDVMYIVHPSYAPRKLSRLTATSFSLGLVPFVRGPFLDTNVSATTITPSADTGAGITLTASTAIFSGDSNTHVGSLWRIKSGVVKITAVTAGGLKTTATADVQAEPSGAAGNLATGPGATTDWAEGSFSGYRGYPTAIAFHEQRLYYANTAYEASKFWGSFLAAYDSFSAVATTADYAVTFQISTEQRNAILWMSSGKNYLTLGSTGGTFSASSGSTAQIIDPVHISVTRDTNYGVAGLIPSRISSFLYYIQRDFNKVRELSFNFYIDNQVANDMTLLSDHILRDRGGIVDLAHQQAPNDRIWITGSDGQLAVLTRNPEQDVAGWCRFIAGTDSTSSGKFESVAVIPKASADDQVWFIVNRTINGVTKRYIEFLIPESFSNDWDAVQLDCSLTLNVPDTITAVSKAVQVVVTYTAGSGSPVLNNADQIKIDNVVGMTQLNGNQYLVSDLNVGVSFKLKTLAGVYVDSSAYSTYISGGESRKMVTNISGLAHLEGEVIEVQTDGNVPATNSFTVASGSITLASKAAVVHAGLPYTGTLQLLKLSDGSRTTGQGKMRRIYQAVLRLYRSVSFKIGRDVNSLDTIDVSDTVRNPAMSADGSVLYTGDTEVPLSMGWSKADEVVIQQSQPLPLQILAVILKSELEEKE